MVEPRRCCSGPRVTAPPPNGREAAADMTNEDAFPNGHRPWIAANVPGTVSSIPRAGPSSPAEAVVCGAVDLVGAPRLDAELDVRIAVGAQVLVVDLEEVKRLDAAVVAVLVDAADHLHDERSGSLVLRNASAPLLQQLRLMRLDHMFELDA